MDELKIDLRELAKRYPRGGTDFRALGSERWIVLQGDVGTLRFYSNGKDCNEIHYTHHDLDEYMISDGPTYFSKDSAAIHIEISDEVLRKKFRREYSIKDVPPVMISDARNKMVWEGAHSTTIAGENSELRLSYNHDIFVDIEYTINPDFGEISNDSIISEREIRIIVRKPDALAQ
jgi:hypothetical protein